MFGFILVLLLGFGCVCWGFLWVLVGFCFFFPLCWIVVVVVFGALFCFSVP